MADSKLSALPAGAAITDADLWYSDQAATSVKQPSTALATYMTARVGTRVIQNTAANILLSTPTAGLIAYATDLGVLFVADGTQWNIDTSYFVLQTAFNDLGAYEFSNRIGYGKTYVTDKKLSNCSIGFGSSPGVDGQIRHGLAILDGIITQTFQIYQNNRWETLAANVALRDIETAENHALQHYPINNWISAFSGDSELISLSGLPTVQGYQVDIGAYAAPQIVNGGSF
jgi:hypothetical protein